MDVYEMLVDARLCVRPNSGFLFFMRGIRIIVYHSVNNPEIRMRNARTVVYYFLDFKVRYGILI